MESIKLDLKPLIRKLEFYSKRFVESEYSGEYISFHRHKGVEFEDYRDFAAGDDASLIDWKASLRSGKLLIRQYSQMKNMNIYILLDVGNSMLFSSVEKLKCEYGAEVAASLAFYFLKSGDNVSLVMFNDRIVKYLNPNTGEIQFSLITRELSNPKHYGGNFNLSNCVQYVNNAIRQGGLVIIISDFIGLEKDWEKSIRLLSKKADIISIAVRDPQDMVIKSKIGPSIVADPYSNKILFVDLDEIKQDYEKSSASILKTIEHNFKKNNAEMLTLVTDRPFIDPLIRFFSKRRTRWT